MKTLYAASLLNVDDDLYYKVYTIHENPQRDGIYDCNGIEIDIRDWSLLIPKHVASNHIICLFDTHAHAQLFISGAMATENI